MDNSQQPRKINARDDNGNPICGAKTRSGGKCRQKPMPNGRCRMHGGTNPGSAKPGQPSPALKHGIYSQFLTPEEQAMKDNIELGAVDDELVLCRIRLRRILAYEERLQAHNDLVLDELKETQDSDNAEQETSDDEGAPLAARRERKYKRYDFEDAVDRLMRRIESLEKTRQVLMGEGGTEADQALDDLLGALDD